MRSQLEKLDVHSLERYKSVHAMMIEEAQSMVNRMEASLEDGGDVKKMLDKRSELSREIKTLKKKVKELSAELGNEVKGGDSDSKRHNRLQDLLEDLED